MNAKKVLAMLLCLLLSSGISGGAVAEDGTLMEHMGEAVVNVMIDLIGTPGDTAEVADWIDLKLAALHRKTDIVVTADIVYGEGQDTVVFSTPITLRSQEGGQFTIDGNGKQILCVQGAGPDDTMAGITVVQNLTFTGGSAIETFSDVYETGSGGALFVMGDLKLVNCSFTGNHANYGAAVCVDGGVILDRCTVDGNIAAVAGAVYALNGGITVDGGTISNNLAREYGGGLYALLGTVTLSNATVKGNAAEYGGGAFAQYGNAEIGGQTVISGNSAGTSGGAVYVGSGSLLQTGGTIEGNTAAYGAVYLDSGSGTFSGGEIRGNTAQYGGGVYAQIADTVFGKGFSMSFNTAETSGGAVYAHEGMMTVSGAVFTGNTAAYGGAVYSDSGQVEVQGGSFLENHAEYGGALYLTSGNLTVSGGLLRGNAAITSGGAAYNNDGDVIVQSGRIRNNKAMYGGGALAVNGDIYVYGGLIFANEAQLGGALYAVTGGVEITGGRITGNTASDSGGGVYAENGAVTDARGAVFGNTPDDIVQP